jgi:hypothetical protein
MGNKNKNKFFKNLPFLNKYGYPKFEIDGEWIILPLPEIGDLCCPTSERAKLFDADTLRSFSPIQDLNNLPIVTFIEMISNTDRYKRTGDFISDIIPSPAKVMWSNSIYIANFTEWGLFL